MKDLKTRNNIRTRHCEISRANSKFIQLLEETCIINDLTLAEFYSIILREYNEATADYWLKKFLLYAKPVPLSILIKAVTFRKEHARGNISFFDAVGYIFAKEEGYIFVTGDKEFEDFLGVEFVQK